VPSLTKLSKRWTELILTLMTQLNSVMRELRLMEVRLLLITCHLVKTFLDQELLGFQH